MGRSQESAEIQGNTADQINAAFRKYAAPAALAIVNAVDFKKAGSASRGAWSTWNPGSDKLNSQGCHRIDFHGAARRDITGGERHQKEQQSDAGEGGGVGSADVE